MLLRLEHHFSSDILTYYGQITDGFECRIKEIAEELATDPGKREKLLILLTTPGGSATAVERYVNIIRHHYREVNFLIPDYAYSAGTIFCMSGDHIYMDYSSVLGPIDPQVQNKEGRWVAALAYLDKVAELMQRAQEPDFTQAEFLILKDIDLAELRGYEQAKSLAEDLVKDWLVKYNFRNEAMDSKKELPLLSLAEQEQRALEIARSLSNNNRWKLHGRPIHMHTLQEEIKLRVYDFSDDPVTYELIKNYHRLVSDYADSQQFTIFVLTRKILA